jgi:hypothetical protein
VLNDMLQNIVRDEYGRAKWQEKWAGIERLPLTDKAWHICDLMGFASPLGEQPFLILDEMLDFRARIVHSKIELVEIQHLGDDVPLTRTGKPARPVSAWERACTMENAVRFRDAARDIAHWFIVNSRGRFGPSVEAAETLD